MERNLAHWITERRKNSSLIKAGIESTKSLNQFVRMRVAYLVETFYVKIIQCQKYNRSWLSTDSFFLYYV